MADGIYAAMSGAMSRSLALDVVAQNVANAPTPGFRASSVAYREAPARAPDAPPATDAEIRMSTLDAVVPSWQPGPLEETGGALDLAIEGDGLFAVRTDAGVRYLRGGSMTCDRDGVLMTSSGHPLLDVEGRPIRLPAEAEPVVGEDGTIRAGERTVGRLAVVWFESPSVLSHEGDNLYTAAAGATPIAAPGLVRQGVIEQANVNVVRGMIDLVSLTRSYEATLRAMESFQNIDRRTVRDLAQG
jgi:flagellar basal body rod protein FlgG